MALALKKYTLVPTAAGTLDPLFPDGSAPPLAPVIAMGATVTPIQLDVELTTPSTGGVAPLTYYLERSETSASAGFSIIHFNAFAPPTSLVYQDTNLENDTQYWYRAFTIDSNATPRQSDYSSVVTGVTDADPGSLDITPPSVPRWVADTGTPVVTTTTIKVSWLASTDT